MSIQTFIQQEVLLPRLQRHGVLVVYDPARYYRDLCLSLATEELHIPSNLVVERVTAHRKPPEVRSCRLRNQSAVGTRPPSTSTPHCPACWARR
jgi:hypothetical protein